ncbi:hypothetical protein [Azospirillum sp. sgz301742]
MRRIVLVHCALLALLNGGLALASDLGGDWQKDARLRQVFPPKVHLGWGAGFVFALETCGFSEEGGKLRTDIEKSLDRCIGDVGHREELIPKALDVFHQAPSV